MKAVAFGGPPLRVLQAVFTARISSLLNWPIYEMRRAACVPSSRSYWPRHPDPKSSRGHFLPLLNAGPLIHRVDRVREDSHMLEFETNTLAFMTAALERSCMKPKNDTPEARKFIADKLKACAWTGRVS
jgi:hypothetical protein